MAVGEIVVTSGMLEKRRARRWQNREAVFERDMR
jgi:hypothetical protein